MSKLSKPTQKSKEPFYDPVTQCYMSPAGQILKPLAQVLDPTVPPTTATPAGPTNCYLCGHLIKPGDKTLRYQYTKESHRFCKLKQDQRDYHIWYHENWCIGGNCSTCKEKRLRDWLEND